MNGSAQTLLQQQLLPLLTPLTSESHQRVLLDHNVLSSQQLRKIDRLFKRLQKQPISSAVDALVQICVQLTDQLRLKADQLGLSPLSEQQLVELGDAWQSLGEEFDAKAQEQQEGSRSMLEGLEALVRQWKGPENIENIVTTILCNQPTVSRLVMVDKKNYARLGLPRYKIGHKYVVFDTLNIEEQIHQINQIGDDFSSIFAENARNNLERLDTSYRYQGDSDLRQRIRILAQQLSPHKIIINNNYMTEMIKFAARKMPNFAPAEWQWPDLVKVRRPYRSLLLGLYRNRTRQHRDSRIVTLSVRKLCGHFRKTGCEFYTSILDSASLLFNSDIKVMSQEGKEFVHMSIVLQIEQNRSTLRKALVVLHQLREVLAQEHTLAPHNFSNNIDHVA
jgi:hypothetical protein